MPSLLTSNGFSVEFDEEDRTLAERLKWYARRSGRTYYAATTLPGAKQPIDMHRLLVGEPGFLVDHIDRNGLNNRRSNLRRCTPSENGRNQKKQIGCKVPFRGVSIARRGSKYFAQIKVGEKHIYLGSFDQAESAARAYDAAAIEYFGEFASLNFPLPAREVPA